MLSSTQQTHNMASERQNEYFIEKDGISREVIQADICRYLGNDALVKPGVHQVRLPILTVFRPLARLADLFPVND